jgi:hypothetical protein
LATNAIYVKENPIYGDQFNKNWILIFGNVLDWNVPEDYSRVSIALRTGAGLSVTRAGRLKPAASNGGKQHEHDGRSNYHHHIGRAGSGGSASVAAFRPGRKRDLHQKNPYLRGSQSRKQIEY